MSTTANIEITASSGRLPAALRAASRLVAGFATQAAGALSALRLAPNKHMMQHAAGFVVGGLAMRGIDVLIKQAHDIFEFNEALTRFGLATRKGGRELLEMGKIARDTSTATGINAIEVIRGERAYVDLAGASKASAETMRLVAASAQATGSDVKDMATVMYSLEQALHISPGELEDTIGGIINQSKDGTVHFQQMAAEIIALAPIYARFGNTGRAGAIEMGAQLQVVRSGFKDAAEAAVGLKNMWRNLQLHADKFEKGGVKIFNVDKQGHKTLRPIAQIIKDIGNSKLNFDPMKLMKAFGRGESERAYRLITENVKKLEELEELGLRNGVVQQDLATYTESSSGRMAVAFEKMKNTLAEAFTPERVNRFTAAIEALADKIEPVAKAVGFIGDVLGKFYSAGKFLREMVTDPDANNPWGATGSSKAEEQLALARHRDKLYNLHRSGGGPDQHPNEDAVAGGVKQAADVARFNRALYSTTVRDIVAAQGGPEAQPNSASIKTAILAAGAQGAGAFGAQTAAGRYLENIPKPKIEQVKEEAFHEQMAPLFDQLGDRLVDALGKNKGLTAREMAVLTRDAIYEARGMVVEIDGNPVAKAGASATNRRRK